MFRNDYSELADNRVLQALLDHGTEQNIGYGLDDHSKNAAKMIADFFGLNAPSVHFLAGGTVTNMTVLSHLLLPYQAVIACDTAHINVHETGAVEASGHKVLTVPNIDGKITAEGIEHIVKKHGDEHMVKPSVVYISFATETGSVYSSSELKELRKICDKYSLKLFLDGARLGVGLVASDVTPALLGEVCDVFYVGGTKNGALFGEAVVIKDEKTAEYFRYHVKNRGAMLAKGFAVGIQFETLFKDGLYLELAKNSVKTALKLREGLKELGYKPTSSPTNQQFVEFDKKTANVIANRYGCEVWEDKGETIVLRFVTSFATKEQDVDEVLEFLKG